MPKSINYLVIFWYTDSKTWRKIKDNRVDDKKLLVARSDKRYIEVYRQVWFVLDNKELYENIGRETNGQYIW